jgi:hypothetical protein
MSRRGSGGGVDFGSDSFLDVIANIVGILIILIVLAGLRVANTPVVLDPESANVAQSDIDSTTDPGEVAAVKVPSESIITIPGAEEPISLGPPTDSASSATDADEAAPGAGETSPESVIITSDDPAPGGVAEPELLMEPRSEEIEPLVVAPPPELVERSSVLEAEVSKFRDQQQRLVLGMRQVFQRRDETTRRIAAAREQLQQRHAELTAAQESAAKAQSEISQQVALVTKLQRQIELLEARQPAIESLEHRVTPVSRVVRGTEKHYRVHNNRVSEVPLDDLVGRVKEQLERRKDWLAKMSKNVGEVGPIQGYSLKYQVVRENGSVLDELQMGQGVYRLSVSQWQVVPAADLRGETADEALTAGSKFYRSLVDVPDDTSITFWVYPESFPAYRRLQQFAHQQGFSVAGRPLPPGVPIAGSPNGTKSAAQ